MTPNRAEYRDLYRRERAKVRLLRDRGTIREYWDVTRDEATAADEHGLWAHQYVIRPHLDADRRPLWAPLLPARHIDVWWIKQRGELVSKTAFVSWEAPSAEYPRRRISTAETLYSLEPGGPVLFIAEHGGRVRCIDGTLTLRYGERPLYRGVRE